MKGDKEVVLVAVASNEQALCRASDMMQADKEVVLAAIQTEDLECLSCVLPGNAGCADRKFRDDKDVVLAALTKDACLMDDESEWLSDRLKKDKDVVAAAAKCNWKCPNKHY